MRSLSMRPDVMTHISIHTYSDFSFRQWVTVIVMVIFGVLSVDYLIIDDSYRMVFASYRHRQQR